jgi:hypothetical protein
MSRFCARNFGGPVFGCGNDVCKSGSRVFRFRSRASVSIYRVFVSGSRVFNSGNGISRCGYRVFTCGDDVFMSIYHIFDCGNDVSRCGDHVFECGDAVVVSVYRVFKCVEDVCISVFHAHASEDERPNSQNKTVKPHGGVRLRWFPLPSPAVLLSRCPVVPPSVLCSPLSAFALFSFASTVVLWCYSLNSAPRF